jgi:hypothetical protein
MNASQDLGLDVKIARSLPSNHMQAYYHKRDGIIQISSSERRMVSFGINIDGLVTIDCDDSGRIVDVEIVLSRNIKSKRFDVRSMGYCERASSIYLSADYPERDIESLCVSQDLQDNEFAVTWGCDNFDRRVIVGQNISALLRGQRLVGFAVGTERIP